MANSAFDPYFRGLLLQTIGLLATRGWTPKALRGHGVIICLHSIADRPARPFDPMKRERIRPGSLNALLCALRAAGTPIIPLGAIPEALQTPQARPFVCFTFDDGYRDNWAEAWPILRRWNAPFTMFLTTAFVDGRLPPCWNLLERIIYQVSEFRMDSGGVIRYWPTARVCEKNKAFREAAKIFRAAGPNGVLQLTEDLAARYGDCVVAEARADAMTWDQAREVASDPLADLGAHTLSHPVLGQLTRAEAWYEIWEAKQTIEREVGLPVRHFAYPFGNEEAVGPWGMDLAREAEFDLAVTTERETLRESDLNRLYALPRITLGGLYQSVLQTHGQISGVPAAVKKLMTSCL